jgi:hypothetical protein
MDDYFLTMAVLLVFFTVPMIVISCACSIVLRFLSRREKEGK